MKQKVVIHMNLSSEKKKNKAMMKLIETASEGRIDSCAFEGNNRDNLVVVGENIEPSCLVRALKKSFGYARTISVEVVDTNKKKKAEKENEGDARHGTRISYGYPDFPNPNPRPQVVFYGMPADPPSCIVM